MTHAAAGHRWRSAAPEAARRALAAMRDLSWPLPRTELVAMLDRLGWRTVRVSVDSLGVDAGLGLGPGEEVSVVFGAAGETGIGELHLALAENPMEDTPEAMAFLQDTFATIAAAAIDELGPPTSRSIDGDPELRWRGGTGTLTLGRTARRVDARVQSNEMQDLEDTIGDGLL